MERRVGSGPEGDRQVLVSERLFPGEAVVVHDGGRHPGDAGLDAQGLEIAAKQAEQLVAGGRQGRGSRSRSLQQSQRQERSDSTHVEES